MLVLVLVGAGLLLRERPFEVETGSEPRATTRPGQAAGVLRDLERAVRDRDAAAAEALAPPGDDRAASALRAIVRNAQDLDVVDFSVRYVDETGPQAEDGGWRAAVDTTWAFSGFDDSPALAEVMFSFVPTPEGVGITRVGGAGRRTPVWLSGRVEVRRSPTTLVLTAGDAAEADRYAELAQNAIPVVRQVLTDWEPRLVVEVPGSIAGLHAALGSSEGEFDAIAAITSTVDGSLTPSAPMHVFVNPVVLGGLEPPGAQVVISHEAVHVATLAATSPVPLWLLEGFADYVALRDVALPLETTAGQIARQVRRDGAPEELPGPNEFGTTTQHLGAAYEAAWLACVELVEQGGEQQLVELYERTNDGADPDRALEQVFGITTDQLVAAWRERLERLP
ncbi:hypothetical protein [Nocardioides sp.]|uniref:hypothetical protein n=1 Tax=Nocardioides sp. TaxID=35761 RepID=UPI0027364678|nr:hypothetical protein [Nocardioides sp.]MDP3894127.1 hypothetical protein [Nocardioides sp.]